jgi:hypothetical protein
MVFPEKSETVCEGHGFSIGCPSNQRLHIISALYGRNSEKVCLHNSMSDLNCKSSTAEDNVKSLCNDKQSCEFTVNTNTVSDGKDPCQGTYKYLDVKYQCLLIAGEILDTIKKSTK